MELLNFIKLNKDWKNILSTSPYNIKIVEDGEYIILKYSQIESDFSIELVQKCRGCILKLSENNPKYVCRPFDKFFNYGEPYAAELNWNLITITEKIDGSLIKVWYDNEEWHVSTNGTIDAKKATIDVPGAKNFYDLFKKAVLEEYKSMEKFYEFLSKDSTHMFELVSPYTKIVIPYEKTKLYYLDSRDNKTGKYYSACTLIKRPKEVFAKDLKELIDITEKMDWMHEGFVAFDGINRIKVKSPAYVLAHHARNNGVVTWKHIVKVILDNEADEFLTYCPEFMDKVTMVYDKLSLTGSIYKEIYKEFSVSFNDSRADYAKKVNSVPSQYHNFLFKCYDKRENIYREWLHSLKIDKVVELLELEMEE